MPAGDALRRAGLQPLRLDGRDALALVNGTSLTAAAAGLALASIRRSHLTAQVLSALLADILGCTLAYLSENLLTAFGHEHAAAVGREMRGLLAGAEPTGARGLQEPYSLRCGPQLLGAAGSALDYVASVIEVDLNGISDNPVFFPEQNEIAHGGNFFGQPVAFAADLLTNTTVQMGNLAERQLDLMVDPHRNSGLPPVLATIPGEQHGVQGVQLAATATVADMRRNATPAAMQSLPTNLHNQDIVPFGTQAALNALDQSRSLRWLHGALAVALRQASVPTAPACSAVMDRLIAGRRRPSTRPGRAARRRRPDGQVDRRSTPIDPDRPLDLDVQHAADVLDDYARERIN